MRLVYRFKDIEKQLIIYQKRDADSYFNCLSKDYHRKNYEFSLCGLACNLCVMYLGKYCPGCGNGNQSCRLKRCAIDH